MGMTQKKEIIFSEWSSKKRKHINKNSSNRAIIHILFHEIISACTDYLEEDDFWYRIFYDAARGKFPKGINYKDRKLSKKIGKKIISLQIPDDEDVDTSVEKIIKFFQRECNIYSPLDLDKNMLSNDEDEDYEKTYKAWNNCSDMTKKFLIIDYIDKLEKKYKLVEEELIQLKKVLSLCLSTNSIRKKDVILEKNEILDIPCLKMNKNRIWSYDSSKKIKFDEDVYMKTKLYDIDKKYFWNADEMFCKIFKASDSLNNKKPDHFSQTSDISTTDVD